MKILIVCLGNICRSPLGEGILQHKSDQYGLGWEVDSAGTGDWHVGAPPHKLSQKVALQNGVDITRQRGRQFVKEDLLRFDRIYFMDRNNRTAARQIAGQWWDESKCSLLLEELYPGEYQNVPDPYGHPEREFEMVYQMIDAACDAIVKRYGEVKSK
jgi:protein-tyrosine phosphatase